MRNCPRTRRSSTLTTSLLLATAAGCSVDGEVSVGQTGDTLNLDQCYGGHADCDQGFDVLGADVPEPITCTTGSTLLGIETPLPDVVPSSGALLPVLLDAALAPDGSYWLVWELLRDDGDPEDCRLRIEHLEANGTLLGSNDSASIHGWIVGSSLFADELGGAEIAVYTQYAPNADTDVYEATVLYHYLPDVALRTPPIELSGVAAPFLAVDDGGAYVVAGNAYRLAKRGVMGHIERDGTLVMSTNAVPTRGSTGRGLVAFTAHEEGGYTLLAEKPDSSDSAPTFHVLRYDRSFQPEWSISLPSPAAPGYGANMATDRLGRVVAAAVLGDDWEQSLGVYGYDSDGTPRFVIEPGLYGGDPIPHLFSNRESSTVWLDIGTQGEFADGGMVFTGNPRLMAIDVAEASCVIHSWTSGSDASSASGLSSQATEGQVPTPVFVVLEDRIVRLSEAAL